jgi:hypothetical protein
MGDGTAARFTHPKPARRKDARSMPRKPNYQFERLDRERVKAAKAAEKAALKREQKEREKPASETENS